MDHSIFPMLLRVKVLSCNMILEARRYVYLEAMSLVKVFSQAKNNR